MSQWLAAAKSRADAGHPPAPRTPPTPKAPRDAPTPGGLLAAASGWESKAELQPHDRSARGGAARDGAAPPRASGDDARDAFLADQKFMAWQLAAASQLGPIPPALHRRLHDKLQAQRFDAGECFALAPAARADDPHGARALVALAPNARHGDVGFGGRLALWGGGSARASLGV